jgi:hypothetical protein
MGIRRGPYEADFPKGTAVRVADLAFLQEFEQTWRLHHPLQAEQLAYAGHDALVAEVSFYHGGDELYRLTGIPGIWHEQCLREHHP